MAVELNRQQQLEIVGKHLGWAGVMLSGSKRAPKSKLGTHFVVWNSNIVVEGYGKVWYGDFDITEAEETLKALARDFGRKVYVLREMDGRFEYEGSPKTEKAVYLTDGITGEVGGEYINYYQRNEKSQRIVEKPREKDAS
jgi:hypothetical protein